MRKKRSYARRRVSLWKLGSACAILCVCFTVFSPIRLGETVKTMWYQAAETLIRASLYFELNPFLSETEAQPVSDFAPATTAVYVPVIDQDPTVKATQSDSIYTSDSYLPQQEAEPEPAAPIAAEITYRNETSYTPDTAKLLAMADTVTPSDTGPQVLIVHTHTSESYLPDTEHPYTPDDNNRTLDAQFNMIRIGDVLEQRLTDAGIGVIHAETVHDYPSYTGSYSRSLDTVEAILSKHPGIQIVLDLHRDAIIGDDGIVHKTSAEIERDGKHISGAQLMLVVGTNEGGLKHPDWEKNLSFAVKLQTALDAQYPGLMRPINLRSERFNQHVAPGALLLEVGSSGNTLGEALTAIDLFADGLIALLQPQNRYHSH